MRDFAWTPKKTGETLRDSSGMPGAARAGQKENPDHRLRRGIGNQGMRRLLETVDMKPSLIPLRGGGRGIDLQPKEGGGGPAGGASPAAADACSRPLDMIKVTSGPFLGGLTMNDYYPDLAFRNYPADAGPFDLGDRAGSSVQLVGVIPSPCNPSDFTLAQTFTVTRSRVNGSADGMEGQSGDDVARSGRDAASPPFRQEFLGGGAAPLGYLITFADPPSIPYDSTTATAEFDVDFVSSLAGPAGRSSVDWSISVRILGGIVRANMVR